MSIFSVIDLDVELISQLNCFDFSSLQSTINLMRTNSYYHDLLKTESIYFSTVNGIFLREWYFSTEWSIDYTMDQLLPILLDEAISEDFLLMALEIAEEKDIVHTLTKTLLQFISEQGDHPAFIKRVLEQTPYPERYHKRRMNLLREYADEVIDRVHAQLNNRVDESIVNKVMTLGALIVVSIAIGSTAGHLLR